jgi:hypothetical protein
MVYHIGLNAMSTLIFNDRFVGELADMPSGEVQFSMIPKT